MVDAAIVGIGCRLPGGVHGPEELWRFLLDKGDGMVDIPSDRWSLEKYYDPDPEVPGRMYTRRGGFLTDDYRRFDPEFFGISAREASIMDPQQRLLLEVAQEALDDAGHAGTVAGRPVGVYVGGFTMDNQMLRHTGSARAAINSHTATSGTYTMLSNRVSFVFDLRGPSMTIDTACSSSLVALHEAVSALGRGEIEMAIVGGVNAMLTPETFVAMCKGRFLAPDGRCKTFDASADGYARGEGAGVLVLRPVEAARADGDRVYAVVKATGSNQDGRTTGITVPNPQAQADLIREVTARAGIDPAQIGFVEAHGTGTAVGDPLEMEAIGTTLGRAAGRLEPVRVGSIKASVGHLEAAAGVTSVIKAALTLFHRQIAPQGWLEQLNPTIPFAEHGLKVAVDAEPFPATYPVPAVSVNGFGYGGTNAHAVLVAADAADAADVGAADVGAPSVAAETHRERPAMARVFPLSGRTEAGVSAFAAAVADAAADAVAAAVGDAGEASTGAVDALADAIWVRRAHQPVRAGVAYRDAEDLLEQLRAIADGAQRAGQRTLVDGAGPVFVLSGMGPQWWGMARTLLTADGTFRATAEQVDAIFTELAGYSLIAELLRPEELSQVTSTPIAQAGNFLVQVALAAELAEWGVRPSAIVGHSVGEVSAAYLSGMLTLREAVTVSYHRGRLQSRQAGTGGMLAVGLAEDVAAARIRDLDGVEIAAVNSPTGVTLAGDSAPLARLEQELSADGVFARALRVEVPYHSHLMDPILSELRTELSGLHPAAPTLPLYSTVTGSRVTGTDEGWGPRYWADNVRRSVRFADAIGALIADGHRVFLEVGPHPVLSGNIREVLLRRGETGAVISTLNRTRDDVDSVRAVLADLYGVGAVSTTAPPGGLLGPVRQQPLPTHEFQRVDLWVVDERVDRELRPDPDRFALPGERTDATAAEWEIGVSVAALPWIDDHVVAGVRVLPGAAYLDAALSAARELTGRPTSMLADLRFVSPLVIGEHEAPVVRTSVDGQTNRFTIRSRPADGTAWTVHAHGRIVDADATPVAGRPASGSSDASEEATVIGAEELYHLLDQAGLTYGPAFRRVVEARVGQDEVVALIDAEPTGGRAHQVHPGVLDAALQCVAAWVAVGDGDRQAMVPAAVASVRQFREVPSRLEARVTRLDPAPGEADLVADIVLAEPGGEVVLELARVQFRPIAPRPSALTELESLWYEPIQLPLPPLPVGAAAVTPALLVLALGEGAEYWAERLAFAADGRAIVADPHAHPHPDDVRDVVAGPLRELVRTTSGPVLVALSAVGTSEADPATEQVTVSRLAAAPAALAGLARAVQLVLDEASASGAPAPDVRGVVLTRGAVMVQGDREPDLVGATLVGARRVLRNEQPDQHWRLIDLDAGVSTAEALRELVAGGGDSPQLDEVVLRADGVRLGQQVQRTLGARRAALDAARPVGDPQVNFALEVPSSHLLDELAWRQVDRRAPAAGEIELRVDALELNYKDALKALGMLDATDLAGTYFGLGIGMHGMGVVERVGPGTAGIAVGDVLMFGAAGMARRYLTVPLADLVYAVAPKSWTAADFGSGVPLMTAYFCVHDAARVRPGETVLVHGAAGGVGMAATMIAKAAGARVIATAGTPERRAAAQLHGADAVLDSRSLSFVEQVRRLTAGRGVDVVISSAPGEFVAANLEVAAEFGRVVEVGKSEVFTGRAISLRPFVKNLSFISMDLDRMTAVRPHRVREILTELTRRVEDHSYRALPGRLVPAGQAGEALAAVMRSEHVGRVVLDLTQTPPVRPAEPEVIVDGEACYLITGGFGAFGLATARWLAGRGARHLVLAGRSGATTAQQKLALAALGAAGVDVVQERLDVADAAAVQEVIDRLVTARAPLRGVFHTAGVIRDEPYPDLGLEALHEVLEPKAVGALNLHRALDRAGARLDHFVLYSSVTSLAGTVPQSAYAAANAVLDLLAWQRRGAGLPAVTVNWGALEGGGMAEASEEVSRYLALLGLRPFGMDRACEYLELVLGLDAVQVAVADLDWARWGQTHPASAATLRYEELVRAAGTGESAAGVLRTELAALPADQRAEVFGYVLCEQIAAVLGVPPETIDVQSPLPELGLDSLMAVELSARIATSLDLEISALEFTRGGGVTSLATRLLDRMGIA